VISGYWRLQSTRKSTAARSDFMVMEFRPAVRESME
jgi:hypothetical protein